jgi:hypothetical protein
MASIARRRCFCFCVVDCGRWALPTRRTAHFGCHGTTSSHRQYPRAHDTRHTPLGPRLRCINASVSSPFRCAVHVARDLRQPSARLARPVRRRPVPLHSRVPVQTWEGRAHLVPVQTWEGRAHLVPVQTWEGRAHLAPVQRWERCRRWVAGNSAGGPKAAATFKYNPRYLFRPSAATTSVWVGIEQVLPGTPRYSPVLPGASRLGARDDGPTEGCIHTSARAHAVEERTQ